MRSEWIESLGLKALEDFNVGIGGYPPQLNSIGPYRFEYCFVQEEFAFCG
jgi:hypothetical protein